MKLISKAITVFLVMLCFVTTYSQTLPAAIPTLTRFQTIEVLEKSIFKGELILDSNLSVKGPITFTYPVKFPGLSIVGEVMDGILALDNNGLLKNLPLARLSQELKKVQGHSVFQQLESTQKTILSGEVILAEGTIVKGDGFFENTLKVAGNLEVGGIVKLTGLQQADSAFDGLLTADSSGTLKKISNTNLALALNNTGVFQHQENLEVTNNTVLNGNLTLAEGTEINGVAVFTNEIKSLEDFSVAGTVAFTNLPTTNFYGAGNMVLGADVAGNVIKLDLSEVGIGPDGCKVELDGTLSPQTSRWKYTKDYIYTSDCTPNVKLGLGTSTPRERLDVKGNGIFSGGVFAGRKTGYEGANHEFTGKMIIGGDVNNESKFLSLGYDGSHVFMDAKGVNSEFLINYYSRNTIRIGSGGLGNLAVEGSMFTKKKLGIGTETPVAKIHVQNSAGEDDDLMVLQGNSGQKFKVKNDGRAFAKQVIVQLSGFPDYVFTPEYVMPTISELDEFIKTYGRLPKMPSAQQVASEGADIGEITRLLVEKVEEMSLYIIQLEKEMKELKSKMITNPNKQ